jgi:hypothetical protein
MRLKRILPFVALLVLLSPAAYAARSHTVPCTESDCIRFPADAGFINVRDYGARGNGVTDDTKAINAALAASGADTDSAFWQDKIVYFPDGVYLVSAPIMKQYVNGRFASGMMLMGQSREHTIIRLRNYANGYCDPMQPRAIVYTTSKLLGGDPKAGGKDYLAKGEGNDAYANFIENLSIDAGKGNPGAIGIDYLANNLGAIRNVHIYAAEGSGAVGVALLRKWPGPALLEDVTVDGFDTGIDADNTEYSMTLENITLSAQRSIGLRNAHNVLAVHNIHINDAPSPVVNTATDGLIVIEDGAIHSTHLLQREAVSNMGYLNLRNVKVNGYATVLGQEVKAVTTLDGIYEANAHRSGSKQGWSLPVKYPPAAFAEPPLKWVSVADYGARPDTGTDSTSAIVQAFASGAATVYFPHGTYYISNTIDIPPSVRRIVGMMSALHVYKSRSPSFRRDQGMLRARNDKAPLTIEHMAFDNSNLGDQVGLEADGSQPLVLRDIVGAGVTTLQRPALGGEVFIEDACCGPLELLGNKGVWARQLDVESGAVRVKVAGTPLWVLGLKSEGDYTIIDASKGARVEVMGGLIYMVKPAPDIQNVPAFRASDSHIYLSYAEEAFDPQATYPIHLETLWHGKKYERRANSLPKRNVGRMAPQLVN